MAVTPPQNACCMDPKTRVSVDVEKLISAIEKAKTRYVAENEKAVRDAVAAWKKYRAEMRRFCKANAEYIRERANVLDKIGDAEEPDDDGSTSNSAATALRMEGFSHRTRGCVSVLDVSWFFEDRPVTPKRPSQTVEKLGEQKKRAIQSFDVTILELRMSAKKTVSVSVGDFRRYVEKC